MAHFAYYRTSSREQSVESQRSAMAGGPFAHEYIEQGVSGGVPAAMRPEFAKLLKAIRAGDTLHVYAVDRLGRDAIDVQATVKALSEREEKVHGKVTAKGVAVHVRGLGVITGGAGRLVLAVLAQVAEMEKSRIRERTAAGRDTAMARLAAGQLTQHNKASMGRPRGAVKGGVTVDPRAVVRWKEKRSASIAETAAHWKVSASSVKRYAAAQRS